MAGTIIVDRIESDASYASNINVAGQITFSNTVNFGITSAVPVAGFYSPSTNNVAFTTASTERMRIDSSGNMGVGLTNASTYGRFAVNTPTGGNGVLSVRDSVAGGGGAQLAFYYGTFKYNYIDACVENGTAGLEQSRLTFSTTNAGTLA